MNWFHFSLITVVLYSIHDITLKHLAGTKFFNTPDLGNINTPNLTPGGVCKSNTDLDWDRAIRHGVARDSRPEMFDEAYLSCRYRNEYDVPDMPGFVKKVMMPIAYFIGKLTGKYSKFKDAPKSF